MLFSASEKRPPVPPSGQRVPDGRKPIQRRGRQPALRGPTLLCGDPPAGNGSGAHFFLEWGIDYPGGQVERITQGQYLDLLRLADAQEDMIDRYLERGTMYALEDDGLASEVIGRGNIPLSCNTRAFH